MSGLCSYAGMRGDVSICGCLIRLRFVCNTNLKEGLTYSFSKHFHYTPRQVTAAEGGADIALGLSPALAIRFLLTLDDTARSMFLSSHQALFQQPP
jgi:hypothetical protein